MHQETVLSPKEKIMYETVLQVLDGSITKEQAAARLGVSERTVRRKIDAILHEGMGGIIHKSRGKSAHNRTDPAKIAQVVWLYETRYIGYNFSHFHQKLVEEEHIHIAYPTLYDALSTAGFTSPKAKRRKKKELHPTRERRHAFGELIQMDASVHNWFAEEVCNLHLAIDDATSQILAGYFEEQETLHGYYMTFAQVLRAYGAPEEIYTDRRTVFRTSRTRSDRLEEDAGTQFRMAAARFGVLEIHTTSVPQAKGRVERAFGTLQDRLVSEMRSAHIANIEEANAFLPAFLEDYNRRFALEECSLEFAFGSKPTEREIDLGLAIVCERKVSNGSTVSYKGRQYAPYDKTSRIAIAPKTHVLVLKSLEGQLYMVNGDNVWPLVDVHTQRLPTPEMVKDRIYIPPKGHPWKEASYQMMLKRLRRVC